MPQLYFDELETQPHEQRQERLFNRLSQFLQGLVDDKPAWAAHFANLDVSTTNSPNALAKLPVFRKSDLIQKQADTPPFAGLSDDMGYARAFMSPGPIFEPQPYGADPWNIARALFAAGFRSGELLHNCFSYHMSPGGFILDEGARALGLRVFPAGVGNTEMQVEAIAHLRPSGYCGTPDYLKVILDKAKELGRDARSITKAFFSGGALFQSLRDDYTERGVAAFQAYVTADVGCIAYESSAKEGMIVNENIIVEIVQPGTGDLVSDGEVGEVVVTTFNKTYPLVRFATGDLSAFISGVSPCGRTNRCLKGWLGRADQTAKIKGMFVHTSQIAHIVKQHPELKRVRLVITREHEQDVMTLMAESSRHDEDFAHRVSETLAMATKLKGTVILQELGFLPNDGIIISDKRAYQK